MAVEKDYDFCNLHFIAILECRMGSIEDIGDEPRYHTVRCFNRGDGSLPSTTSRYDHQTTGKSKNSKPADGGMPHLLSEEHKFALIILVTTSIISELLLF